MPNHVSHHTGNPAPEPGGRFLPRRKCDREKPGSSSLGDCFRQTNGAVRCGSEMSSSEPKHVIHGRKVLGRIEHRQSISNEYLDTIWVYACMLRPCTCPRTHWRSKMGKLVPRHQAPRPSNIEAQRVLSSLGPKLGAFERRCDRYDTKGRRTTHSVSNSVPGQPSSPRSVHA